MPDLGDQLWTAEELAKYSDAPNKRPLYWKLHKLVAGNKLGLVCLGRREYYCNLKTFEECKKRYPQYIASALIPYILIPPIVRNKK